MAISWKGYSWDLRSGAGGPGYASWATANVTGPDANDYITLKITNPTGVAPVGCEMDMTQSLGYGTYTLVTGSRFDNLDKNIVFGGLFPYFGGSPFIEFDVGEVSNWDRADADAYGPDKVYISHNSWWTDSLRTHTSVDSLGADQVYTFVFTWSAGRAEYWTYLGTGTGGTLLLNSVHTANIPVPSTEKPIINLWCYDSNQGSTQTLAATVADDKDVPATNIILRDFYWTAPGASTDKFDLALSSTVTNGDVTTAQLNAPTSKTTADFQAGILSESSSPMGSLNLTSGKYTELEWVLAASTSAVTGTQYEFRVTNAGTALDTYSVTPKWTIGTSPTTFKPQSIIC